jgi:hypothetical protein
MARRRRVLVIECIPQSEKYNEGKMLRHFLDMIFQNDRGRVIYYRVKSKKQLVNYVDQKRDIYRYGYVHLSAHGKPKLGALELPRGRLYPSDLRQDCFKGRILALSACSAGRKGFVAEMIARTGAEAVIAPRNDVWFADAALWFTNFYYLVLEAGYEPKNACSKVNSMLRGKVKGGFKFFDGKDVEPIAQR